MSAFLLPLFLNRLSTEGFLVFLLDTEVLFIDVFMVGPRVAAASTYLELA